MIFKIEHTNTFHYEAPVDQSLNHVRLKPRTDVCQRLLTYRSEISPMSMSKEYTDLWGNHVETFFIPEQHRTLSVKTTSMVSVQRSPYIGRVEYSPEMQDIFRSSLFRQHYLAFLNETPYTFMEQEQIETIIAEAGSADNPVRLSLKLMKHIHDTFAYDKEATSVNTKANEAYALGKGVCQDFAHVMIGVLRSQGVPARYVSGYLYIGEDSGFVGDAATHAWVEVMIPGIGWVGLDPTNNVEALGSHIRVGTGRDYADVSPLQGVYRGGRHTLDVRVGVTVLEK
ncbi:transglutaminase family protein [Paenibacillus hemerocallicola]|uniref:Transglutaminase family protein n=1 Tax=Paenibacillus hemerocallicola TaxID=1172614 RepID=A0A5C4SZM4_9BACL|nr:transglutaminase family protein [Paenibacillus hemerocallicola]TNJ60310.1 transglutaminase family protein [Paenibacillus hemerocallicola]